MSKLIKNVDSKIKKMFHKVKFLSIELNEIEEEIKGSIQEFQTEVRRYCEEKNITDAFSKHHSSPPAPEPEQKVEHPRTKNIKKLYKDIANVCHPDRTSSITDEFLKRKMDDTFMKAASAAQNGSILGIIECAEEMGLNVENLGVDELMWLYEEAETIQRKIKENQNTFSWQWLKSGKSEKWIQLYLEQINPGVKK